MWICEYCRGVQKAGTVSCPCCGAHRGAKSLEPQQQPGYGDPENDLWKGEVFTANEMREKCDAHRMMENIFWPVSVRT